MSANNILIKKLQSVRWEQRFGICLVCGRFLTTAKKHGFYPLFMHPKAKINSTSTPFTLHCCLPVLLCAGVHWTGKLASNSLNLNPVDYSLWRALQQMVYRQKMSETRANRLLDSAKPGHIELSDQSAAKKTDDGYQDKVCHMLTFVWTNSVCR